MNRTRLGIGRKSLDRGSTFATPRSELQPSKSMTRRRPISPASVAQRAKVRNAFSIVSGETGCTPAHIWPRGMGGCDHPLCVVPLTFTEHRLYDDGRLDLLPYLLAAGAVAEMQHALGHCNGSPLRLLHQLTGQHWQPSSDSQPNRRNG